MKAQDIAITFQLFNEVGIISQLSNALLDKNLPYNLKASQFAVLNHLIRVNDGTTHAQLAANMQVTKGAMTNTLNRLIVHDLVDIKIDTKDARIKRVYITDKGRAVRDESIQSINPAITNILREFNVDDFTQAIPFLTQLRKVLDNNR